MAKKGEEEVLILWEPPVKASLVSKGKQQSIIRTPDGVEQALSNEWIVFEITDEDEEAYVAGQETQRKAEPNKMPAITGRHGKVPVFVNGSYFDSVRKAFVELKLPVREKSRVRRSLRSTGEAKVRYQDEDYIFTRAGNNNGDDDSSVDC